jgi:hypothetical protein
VSLNFAADQSSLQHYDAEQVEWCHAGSPQVGQVMLGQLTSLRRGKLKIPEHAYNNPMLTGDPIQWWEDYGHTC